MKLPTALLDGKDVRRCSLKSESGALDVPLNAESKLFWTGFKRCGRDLP